MGGLRAEDDARMNEAARLSGLFLPHVAEAQRGPLSRSPGLEDTLATVLSIAADRWPQIRLQSEDFLPFLARRMPAELVAAEELFDLEVGDLYLLCAYERRDAQAVVALETNYMARVEAGLARFGATRPMIEDIRQVLHQRLLTAERGVPGSLRYHGKGALVRWMYVSATRTALDVWRKSVKVAPLEDAHLERAVLGEDHEVAYLKLRYRAEFKEAFQAAFATLSKRDRNVLRYYILDQLNIEQMGAIYRVHRATVARWIAAARQHLLVETRSAMLAKIQSNQATFESVMRLIESELEVSMRRLLEQPPADLG